MMNQRTPKSNVKAPLKVKGKILVNCWGRIALTKKDNDDDDDVEDDDDDDGIDDEDDGTPSLHQPDHQVHLHSNLTFCLQTMGMPPV